MPEPLTQGDIDRVRYRLAEDAKEAYTSITPLLLGWLCDAAERGLTNDRKAAAFDAIMATILGHEHSEVTLECVKAAVAQLKEPTDAQ